MRASDIMTRPVITVGPDDTVRDAAHLLVEHGFAGLPVVDDDERVIGVITEADVLAASSTGSSIDGPVAELMSRPVEVVAPDADGNEVVRRMLDGRLRCMPVVQHGELIGVISRRDLLRPMIRSDDAIAIGFTSALISYAGYRRRWHVSVLAGAVTISGHFRDDAERQVVIAVARTVTGVVDVTLTEEVLDAAAR